MRLLSRVAFYHRLNEDNTWDSICMKCFLTIVWPDSTSRTASSLNSSVYLPRLPFLIVVSLSLLKQLAKGYVLRGQGHPL